MNEIQIPFQRARLVPLKPRSEQEAIQLQQLCARLQAAAAADNHHIFAPTHVMVQGEEILGYLSIDGLPTVHAWFDSKHKHAAHSLRMIEYGEVIGREKGLPHYCVAVAEQSPFSQHMPRLGYEKLGTTVLWVKAL